MQSCEPPNDNDLYVAESDGLSGWSVTVIIILILMAFGGLAFVGFTFYRRYGAYITLNLFC